MFSNSAESSPLDSDEDSNDIINGNLLANDKKRRAHIISEQRRRDAIKKGYDELISLLQSAEDPIFSSENSSFNGTSMVGSNENISKLSKAGLLYKTQEYIQSLQKQAEHQQVETEMLQREIAALEIMKLNYQSMLSTQNLTTNPALHDVTSTTSNSTPLISFENTHLGNQNSHLVDSDSILNHELTETYAKNREIKSQIFYMIMDFLFLTFNASLVTTSFNNLIKSVMSWLEEYCRPNNLKEITLRILRQVNPKLPE